MSKSKVEFIKVSEEKDCISYTRTDIQDFAPSFGEALITHKFLMDSFRKLMGQTLTIIDASIVERQQNKAIKDLIRNVFSDEMAFSSSICFDQKQFDKFIENLTDEEIKNAKPVSIDEALGVK
jgi:hypothetical protein